MGVGFDGDADAVAIVVLLLGHDVVVSWLLLFLLLLVVFVVVAVPAVDAVLLAVAGVASTRELPAQRGLGLAEAAGIILWWWGWQRRREELRVLVRGRWVIVRSLAVCQTRWRKGDPMGGVGWTPMMVMMYYIPATSVGRLLMLLT